MVKRYTVTGERHSDIGEYVLASDYEVSEARRRNMERGMMEAVRVATEERVLLLAVKDAAIDHYPHCGTNDCPLCDALDALDAYHASKGDGDE